MGRGGSAPPFLAERRGLSAPALARHWAARRARRGPGPAAVSRPRARGFPASPAARWPSLPRRPQTLHPPPRPAGRPPHLTSFILAMRAPPWSDWSRNSSCRDPRTRVVNGRKSAGRPADARRERGSCTTFRPPGRRQRPLATGGVLCAFGGQEGGWTSAGFPDQL